VCVCVCARVCERSTEREYPPNPTAWLEMVAPRLRSPGTKEKEGSTVERRKGGRGG